MNFKKDTVIGIELGSTRIKATLIDKNHQPLASGNHTWENKFIDGIWTYPIEEVHTGLQACFADLKRDVREKFGVSLATSGAIGVSAMMHGYLPFDKDGKQLCEFRTWRNTITSNAAEILTKNFGFNIPQRWSIAHYYQAILNEERHVNSVRYLTTLAGYIHWKLTGMRVMGVGEASGMFPIDSGSFDYDSEMLRRFEELTGVHLKPLLPTVLPAGADAGILTQEGALFLDPSGELQPSIPFAPCEGDAGTGMVATNAVRKRRGNVSAGTSVFAMVVTEKMLGMHREIDMVTTPDGNPVAMVHCTNCTSDINAWVNLFGEFAENMGYPIDRSILYTKLYEVALLGDDECGGLLSYNYYSGEEITGLNAGCPLFLRTPNAEFSLANFMRMHLYSALATLKIGMNILNCEEQVEIDKLVGHGGFFKTPEVGQRILSAAIGAPVSVMETAGEGGPYGMALLCAYRLWRDTEETLPDYLDNKVFCDATEITVFATEEERTGFERFISLYLRCFDIERRAVEILC